jgi:hypothetical protein
MCLACVRKSKLYTLRNRLLEIKPLIWIDKCKQNKSSNGRAILTPIRTQANVVSSQIYLKHLSRWLVFFSSLKKSNVLCMTTAEVIATKLKELPFIK